MPNKNINLQNSIIELTISNIYLQMKTSTSNILRNITQIRKDKGLSQENIAEELGINPSTFSKIERGLLGLSFETLSDLADIYNMRAIDIMTYPKQFIDPEKINQGQVNNDFEAVLQIKLPANKRDSVLKFLYGEQLTEILNK